jgi:hypothetical protein
VRTEHRSSWVPWCVVVYGCAEISGNLEHDKVEALLRGGVIKVLPSGSCRVKQQTLMSNDSRWSGCDDYERGTERPMGQIVSKRFSRSFMGSLIMVDSASLRNPQSKDTLITMVRAPGRHYSNPAI